MADHPDNPEAQIPLATSPPVSPRRLLNAFALVVSWALILFMVVYETRAQIERPQATDVTGESRLESLLIEMQGRCITGFASFLGKEQGNFYDQAKTLNAGPVGQRLRYIVLAGELAGPKEALVQVDLLRQEMAQAHRPPSLIQEKLLTILYVLYRDYDAGHFDAPSVTASDRGLLRAELGWFGDLALTPAGSADLAARAAVLEPAYRTMSVIGSFVVLYGGLGVAGFVALILFLAFRVAGKVHGALVHRLPHGGVYAETFAVWMLLFYALLKAAAYIPAGRSQYLVLACAMFLSLVALVWPVLRGIPWQQVREEIGLIGGRRPVVELLLGVGVYAMAIPLLMVGLLAMMLLMRLQAGSLGAAEDPFTGGAHSAHPIIEFVAQSGWWGRVQLLLLASLVAPIVEETMFRGVLYRHLRELTARCGAVLSVLISAILVSFIFAVIHPQGLVAVPALTALALAFVFAREWRGSLVSSMVAHGINNGLLMVLFMLAMGR